jgi:DNA-binding NtrC family response regulator
MGHMISEMRNEINELKKTLAALMQSGININSTQLSNNTTQNIDDETIYTVEENDISFTHTHYQDSNYPTTTKKEIVEEFIDTEIIDDEPLALEEREKNAIRKALSKHNGNRKNTAKELRISERTLYRKLKEYEIKNNI